MAANAIIRRPVGVPQGELRKQDFRKVHDEHLLSPPSALDTDHVYHILGLLYQVIGIDRSLAELFAAATGKNLVVPTYQAPSPVFEVVGAAAHSWHSILQGLPVDQSPLFTEHVQSYAFRDPTGGVWTAGMRQIRIRDPFSSERRGLTACLWLPEYNGQPRAILRRPPGLHLLTPVIEVRAHARA